MKVFILIMTTINCSGRIYGPYGGKGGRYFEAIPPNPHNRDGKKIHCFLGWISGQSDRRLDSISFHWKCPKEPSHMYPEELDYLEYDYSSNDTDFHGCNYDSKALGFNLEVIYCASNIIYVNKFPLS